MPRGEEVGWVLLDLGFAVAAGNECVELSYAKL